MLARESDLVVCCYIILQQHNGEKRHSTKIQNIVFGGQQPSLGIGKTVPYLHIFKPNSGTQWKSVTEVMRFRPSSFAKAPLYGVVAEPLRYPNLHIQVNFHHSLEVYFIVLYGGRKAHQQRHKPSGYVNLVSPFAGIYQSQGKCIYST